MHKILIVEDKRDVRNLLRLTLPFDEFQTREADNGADALPLIRDWHPDLVLLDILMPGSMNGLDVCREVKGDQQLRDILVILLTALGQKSDIENGTATGADAYIVKPFSPSELLAVVRHLLKARNPSQVGLQ